MRATPCRMWRSSRPSGTLSGIRLLQITRRRIGRYFEFYNSCLRQPRRSTIDSVFRSPTKRAREKLGFRIRSLPLFGGRGISTWPQLARAIWGVWP
jgi:hypothetical protein